MKYTARDFREVGITEFNIEPGCGYADKSSEIAGSFIVDFKQFIPHRDNKNVNPIIGNSLTTTKLEHRIIEVDSLENVAIKMIEVAKMFLIKE